MYSIITARKGTDLWSSGTLAPREDRYRLLLSSRVFCVAHREDDMSRHGFTGIVYILIRSPFSVKNAERKALTEAAKEAIARAVNG